MSTYEKLGQYSATELPIAPSNVKINNKDYKPKILKTYDR